MKNKPQAIAAIVMLAVSAVLAVAAPAATAQEETRLRGCDVREARAPIAQASCEGFDCSGPSTMFVKSSGQLYHGARTECWADGATDSQAWAWCFKFAVPC